MKYAFLWFIFYNYITIIKMEFQEVECGCMDRIELAQDRDIYRPLVTAVMNLRFTIKCGKFLD